MFIFLYCFVCQYRSSDWLWRPPPKWPILCRVGRVKLCSTSTTPPLPQSGTPWKRRGDVMSDGGSSILNQEATDRQEGPFPPFPSSSPLSPLPLEVGPLNPARESGEGCKLTQRGLGQSPCPSPKSATGDELHVGFMVKPWPSTFFECKSPMRWTACWCVCCATEVDLNGQFRHVLSILQKKTRHFNVMWKRLPVRAKNRSNSGGP